MDQKALDGWVSHCGFPNLRRLSCWLEQLGEGATQGASSRSEVWDEGPEKMAVQQTNSVDSVASVGMDGMSRKTLASHRIASRPFCPMCLER